MQLGITDHIWSVGELVDAALTEATTYSRGGALWKEGQEAEQRCRPTKQRG